MSRSGRDSRGTGNEGLAAQGGSPGGAEETMTVLKQISVSSLADIAFTKLVEAISAGEFAPGERLSEAEMARRFGISRGPLREALQRLEGRLVNRKPRVGVHLIELSRESLGELFVIREALEGIAAREAARKMRKSEVQSLERMLGRHAQDPALASGSAYRQRSDDDFHAVIVKAARNRQLEEMLFEHLYYQLRLYRYRSSVTPGRAAAAFEEHVQIVDALKAGDPERAEAKMRQHVRNAFASLAQAGLAAPPQAAAS